MEITVIKKTMDLSQHILISGTFVIFQGIYGDGLCNSIDYIEPLVSNVIDTDVTTDAIGVSFANAKYHETSPKNERKISFHESLGRPLR